MSISEGSSPMSRAARGKAAKLLGLSNQEDQPGGESGTPRRTGSIELDLSSSEERPVQTQPSTARPVRSLKSIVEELQLDVLFVNSENSIHSGQSADLLRLFVQCLQRSDISPEGKSFIDEVLHSSHYFSSREDVLKAILTSFSSAEGSAGSLSRGVFTVKKFIALQRRALREDPECSKLLAEMANEFEKGSEAQRGFAAFLKTSLEEDKSSLTTTQQAVIPSSVRRKRRAKKAESVVLSSPETAAAIFEAPLPAPLPSAVPSKASKRLGLVEEKQPEPEPAPLPAVVPSKASKRLGLPEEKVELDQTIPAKPPPKASKRLGLDQIEPSDSPQPESVSPKSGKKFDDSEPQTTSSKAEKLLGLSRRGSSPSLGAPDAPTRRGSKSPRGTKSSTALNAELDQQPGATAQTLPPLPETDATPPTALPSKASLLLGLNDSPSTPKSGEAEPKAKERSREESKKESSESEDRHYSDLLLEYDPDEIADALMQIDMENFKKTQVHEFSFSSYSKQGWKENGLAAFIEHTNRLSRFIAGAILNPKISTERRAKLLTRCISIMESLQSRNDFASMMTIYFTLSSTDLIRLKKTWKFVPRAKVDQFNAYDELLSPISNFSGYRELLAFAELPCVPYTAVTTKDIVAAEEMPTKVAAPSENGQPPAESAVMRINWTKMRTIAKLLSTQISRFWNGFYGATHELPELVAHLNFVYNDALASKLPQSDSFHVLSDEIEPRTVVARPHRATVRLTSSKTDLSEAAGSDDAGRLSSSRGSAPKMSSVIDDYKTNRIIPKIISVSLLASNPSDGNGESKFRMPLPQFGLRAISALLSQNLTGASSATEQPPAIDTSAYFATLLSLILHDDTLCAIEEGSSAAATSPTVFVNHSSTTAEQVSRLSCSEKDMLFILSYLSYSVRMALGGSQHAHLYLEESASSEGEGIKLFVADGSILALESQNKPNPSDPPQNVASILKPLATCFPWIQIQSKMYRYSSPEENSARTAIEFFLQKAASSSVGTEGFDSNSAT